MENLVYILNVHTMGNTSTMCVALNKSDLYLEMKADIFRCEHEDCYTKDYIKKNMPFFEYISYLIPSDIQSELERYSVLETELKGTFKAVS